MARKRLTDHIRPRVRILFVGINPGFVQPLLDITSLGTRTVSETLVRVEACAQAAHAPRLIASSGLGARPDKRHSAAQRRINVLKPSEYAAGRKRLTAKVQRYRPHAVALLGITIYRTLFPEYRTGRISLGLQAKTLLAVLFCSA